MISFTLAALILVAVAGAGHKAIGRLITVDRSVKHTQEVRRLLSDLLSGYQDAETGQRGYLLAGQEAFLEPYKAGLAAVERIERELTRLMSDDHSQQQRLETVRKLGQERLNILQRTMEAHRAKASLQPQTLRLLEDGMDSMRHLRAAVASIDSVEERLLEARRRAAQESADMAYATMMLGVVFGLSALGLACWWMSRTLHQQVGAAVQQLSSSSVELQAVATQQAGGAGQQATAMTEISTTLTELLTTSRQISENAKEVSGLSNQVAEVSQEGVAKVEEGRRAMDGIQRQVGMVVDQMLDLDKKSGQIGSVTEVVAELAEQTNILAINATIEAAGAGTTGVRFGMVADEIRRLADRVSRSTREIRGLLEEIRSSVRTSVVATEAGASSVHDGSSQFDRVAESFQRILRAASSGAEASRGIELSIHQQTTAVEQVNTAIAQLAEGARQTEVGATQTSQTAGQLVELSLGLQRIVSST